MMSTPVNMTSQKLSVGDIACKGNPCELKNKIVQGSLITGVSYGIHNNKSYCDAAFEVIGGIKHTMQLDYLTKARETSR